MKLPIPKGVQRRLRPVTRRGEDFLRGWEWTWTRAFLAAMIISFIAITTMAVIPSWMLYFITRSSGAGTAAISQGGAFSAAAGEVTVLGTSAVDATGSIVARLTVRWLGGVVSCEKKYP